MPSALMNDRVSQIRIFNKHLFIPRDDAVVFRSHPNQLLKRHVIGTALLTV